jgi:hypothetical protein
MKLKQKLTYIKRIYATDIKYSHIVRELFQDKEIFLIEKKWHDSFKQNSEYYPLDLNDTDNWVTYQDCVDIQLDYNHEKGCPTIEVTIWSGRLLNGHKTDRKWSASFELNENHLQKFEQLINWRWRDYLEREHHRREEEKLERELKLIEDELLTEE